MKTKTKMLIFITAIVVWTMLFVSLCSIKYPPTDILFSDTDVPKIDLVIVEDSEEVSDTDTTTDTETEVTVISEEPQEEVIQPVYDYTEEELDLLARLIYSEGGTESYQTQLMIGSVVMNRVSDPAFPDNIRDVIYQENQFSVTVIAVNGVIAIDRPADEEAIEAAREVLTYGSILPPKVQVFYWKECTNSWVTSRETYGTYDNTTFAYIYSKEDN